ncbi:sigma 54-interacting transcriptional regulator [Massilia oculi]|uniref:Sigma-54-dependent Fis family transcriptional regulator n=1 Tax=Massilia oculi TaxID=945844 RepID=A0A2S2DHZ5_9BURK|nr:sigma-54 dependent transcriptional regulator [Massilia oculi]AWL04972.1 sigma-54-dependent Fis family transcriptional regulator [Massilia oculi]
MSVKRLLCISGEGSTRARACHGELAGWDLCVVESIAAARKVLSQQHYGVGLLLDSSDGAGDAEIERFLRQHHHTRWIGVFDAGRLDQPALRELIAAHLFDFHTRPVDALRLKHSLGHAHGMAALAKDTAPRRQSAHRASHIDGASRAIVHLRAHIDKIAMVDAPVLIAGESGSGKELAAQEIHLRSQRAGGPFIAINCAAVAPALIHSELFGHERGAFTGATRDKQGLLEAASGGSIFLDEIGDLPLDLQASLLRFLQERVIYRVGGTRTIAVDARVIAATHVNLPQAVAEGRFREDLYYRLSVFPIRVPPLRERKEDLPLLTDLIFNKYAAERSPQLKGVSREALQAMARYDWPGNVRELINRVRRAMVLAEHRLVMPEDLDLPSAGPICPVREGLGNSRLSAERIAIGESLARSGNNISQAARDLGVSRMTLYRLMAKHAISS